MRGGEGTSEGRGGKGTGEGRGGEGRGGKGGDGKGGEWVRRREGRGGEGTGAFRGQGQSHFGYNPPPRGNTAQRDVCEHSIPPLISWNLNLAPLKKFLLQHLGGGEVEGCGLLSCCDACRRSSGEPLPLPSKQPGGGWVYCLGYSPLLLS